MAWIAASPRLAPGGLYFRLPTPFSESVTELAELGLLFLSGFVAGGINAIAGGGTILTFALLAAILPPDPGRLVAANVTSKLGLWPGAAAAAWASQGSRSELPAWSRWLVVPGVVGAVVGVGLLRWLPKELFDAVVPWLILLAAVLFAVQPQVARLIAAGRPPAAATAGRRAGDSAGKMPVAPPARLAAVTGLLLLVGIYGGYFGAGIGILLLAVLSVLGLGEIHAVNATKNLLAAAINGVATAVLVAVSLAGGFEVSWPLVAVLAAGSIAGGIAVARLAVRLPAAVVRRAVGIIAFALAGYHFWREWSG
jgi:uncharacterized protein